MDRDAKLKEFAAAVFSHVYREYNSTFDLPVKLPNAFNVHTSPDCAQQESAAVLRLCLALRGVFNGLFVKCFESFQRSTQHFMTFLTSRALKLCAGGDDDVFLSFCMVCAFIAELNLFCLINGCFDFLATAPKCLQAIFNRRLRKEFFASGGWESLGFFSEHFASDVAQDEVVSEDLLNSIKEKLDEDSSEEESSSDEEDEDVEEEEEEAEEENVEVVPDDQHANLNKDHQNGNHSSSYSEESDIEESDSESDDSGSSDVVVIPQNNPAPNSSKRPRDDSDSSPSDSEDEPRKKKKKKLTKKPNGLKKEKDVLDTDSDSDSEEESDEDEEEDSEEDTSSMSEEEEESESEEEEEEDGIPLTTMKVPTTSTNNPV